MTAGKAGWWALSALIALVIFGLSSRGSLPIPTPHPLDWISHFGAYLVLGFCLSRATGNWQLAWVCVAWFGALDEVHQAFVPPREAGIGDWWFDMAGAGLGAWWARSEGEKVGRLPVMDASFD